MNIDEGIELFNGNNFFAAHDFFEEKWIDADKKDRLFFQGLVQISVGCFHLISGNHRGALSQLTKGIEKLNGYEPSYFGVNVLNLISDVEEILVPLTNGLNLHPEVLVNMKLPKIINQ